MSEQHSGMRPFKSSYWQDRFIRSLDQDTKMVYLFLITSHRLTLSGVYEITETEIAKHAICDDSENAHLRTRNALRNLENAHKILYEDGWVFLRNRIKHQAFNPNMKKGLYREIEDLKGRVPESFVNPLETLSEGLANGSGKLIPIPILKEKPIPNGSASPRKGAPAAQSLTTEGEKNFQRFWDAYPKRRDRKRAAEAWAENEKELNPITEQIVEAVENQKGGWSDHQFIPYPATYLRNRRWEDEDSDEEVPSSINLNEIG